VYDIKMAVNAGVKSIGVDWGYHDPQDLRTAGAGQVVSNSHELWAALGMVT
jgi:phosphoglycolate phosphatase